MIKIQRRRSIRRWGSFLLNHPPPDCLTVRDVTSCDWLSSSSETVTSNVIMEVHSRHSQYHFVCGRDRLVSWWWRGWVCHSKSSRQKAIHYIPWRWYKKDQQLHVGVFLFWFPVQLQFILWPTLIHYYYTCIPLCLDNCSRLNENNIYSDLPCARS